MKQKFLHASVGVRWVTIFHKRPVVNNQFVVAEISCFRVIIDIKFFDTWQPKMLVLYYKCFPYVSCFNEFGPEIITLLVYYIREVFPDIYSRAF